MWIPYSEGELELLQSFAGDMPWQLVPRHYNRHASIKGYPHRTNSSLKAACDRRGISRASTGEWITAAYISRMMGISDFSVRQWRKRGWLPATQFGNRGKGSIAYIRRRDLRALARERPSLFGGLSVAALTQLLSDEVLAEEIANMELPKPRMGQTRQIICVETGKRYPSIREAAKANYVVTGTLWKVIDRPNRTANNRHFKSA